MHLSIANYILPWQSIFVLRTTTSQSYRRYPLTRMLGNSGHVRLLRVLLLHGGALSSTRLAAQAGLTPQGVRNVLEDLGLQGAVQVLGSRRTRLFCARPEHPMTAAVASLFTDEREQWESFLSSLRDVLSKQSDVVGAWLYGSVARGEDKPESDVDIAVLLQSGQQSEHVQDELSALERQLNARFSIITLKRGELGKVNPSWWKSLIAEALVLKGRRPEEEWQAKKVARA